MLLFRRKPPHIPFPRLIDDQECFYLHELGRKHFQGRGAVVEIGCWLGASTLCLASGLAKNRRAAGVRFHVYDSFLWTTHYAEICNDWAQLKAGESFESNFRSHLTEFSFLQIHRARIPASPQEREGDVPFLRWRSHEPVELLFIDAAKSWYGTRYWLCEFADSLIPGHTLIALQDYGYFTTYWLKIFFHELRGYFTLADYPASSSTVTFRLRKPLPVSAVDSLPPARGAWPAARERAALLAARRQLRNHSDREGALRAALSEIVWLYDRGKSAAAFRLWRHLQARWQSPGAATELAKVARHCNSFALTQ